LILLLDVCTGTRSRLNLGAREIATALSDDGEDGGEQINGSDFRLSRRIGSLMGVSQSFKSGRKRLSSQAAVDKSEGRKRLFLVGGEGGVTTATFLYRLGVSKEVVMMLS
jgi:hypothetical protein